MELANDFGLSPECICSWLITTVEECGKQFKPSTYWVLVTDGFVVLEHLQLTKGGVGICLVGWRNRNNLVMNCMVQGIFRQIHHTIRE